jgi:hypothetical protein
MPTILAGAWRLVVITGDHDPRHVHAKYGSGNGPEAVVLLGFDGIAKLREADRALSRADIRKAVALVQEYFDELVKIWERYC